MPSEYVKDLVDHKRRVAGHMQTVATALFQRAALHDNSKFSPEEFEAYEEAFPELQKYAYGSEEYRAALRKIAPAVAHHYSVNDHHPEHFAGGVEGMSLIQLIEMVCDWLAASERSQKDVYEGLEINKKRFDIDRQLGAIIANTIYEIRHATPNPPTDPNTLYPDVLLS